MTGESQDDAKIVVDAINNANTATKPKNDEGVAGQTHPWHQRTNQQAPKYNGKPWTSYWPKKTTRWEKTGESKGAGRGGAAGGKKHGRKGY